MKREKGITLVALVVTIIVLIILAGISINLILGDNGIITIAKKAKENVEIAKLEEQKELNELYMQIDKEQNSAGGNNDEIEEFIEFKKAIAEAITKAGVDTKEDATKEIMVENIGKIKKEMEFNVSKLLYNSNSNVEEVEFKDITGSTSQSVSASNGSSMYAQSTPTEGRTENLQLITINGDEVKALYKCDFLCSWKSSYGGTYYTVSPNSTIYLYDSNDKLIDSKIFDKYGGTITFSLYDYNIETSSVYFKFTLRAYAYANPNENGFINKVSGTYTFRTKNNFTYMSNI